MCDHQDSFGSFCIYDAEIVVEESLYVCKRCYQLHYIELPAKYLNGLPEQEKLQEEKG